MVSNGGMELLSYAMVDYKRGAGLSNDYVLRPNQRMTLDFEDLWTNFC